MLLGENFNDLFISYLIIDTSKDKSIIIDSPKE